MATDSLGVLVKKDDYLVGVATTLYQATEEISDWIWAVTRLTNNELFMDNITSINVEYCTIISKEEAMYRILKG